MNASMASTAALLQGATGAMLIGTADGQPNGAMLLGAMLIGTAILTALGAWLETAVRDAPSGCDDCQGGDPYCTCHLHTDQSTVTGSGYGRRWPTPH